MKRLSVALFVMTALIVITPKNPNKPTWMECYWLGWYRGVHVELGELPGWMNLCLAGKIPFDLREVPKLKS